MGQPGLHQAHRLQRRGSHRRQSAHAEIRRASAGILRQPVGHHHHRQCLARRTGQQAQGRTALHRGHDHHARARRGRPDRAFRGHQTGRHRTPAARKSACGRRKKWRPSARSPAASRTISTTCSPPCSATRYLLQQDTDGQSRRAGKHRGNSQGRQPGQGTGAADSDLQPPARTKPPGHPAGHHRQGGDEISPRLAAGATSKSKWTWLPTRPPCSPTRRRFTR